VSREIPVPVSSALRILSQARFLLSLGHGPRAKKTTPRLVPRSLLAVLVVSAAALVGCASAARLPVSAGTGPHPTLPAPSRALIPVVHVVTAKGWPAGSKPVAAAGTSVAAFAQGLDHPRWLYVLPNGDVLVAETNAPDRPQDAKGIKGWFAFSLYAGPDADHGAGRQSRRPARRPDQSSLDQESHRISRRDEALRRRRLQQQRGGKWNQSGGGARGDLGDRPRDRQPPHLRLRPRLHDRGPRGSLLRLALQLFRPAPRHPGEAAAARPRRQGHRTRLLPGTPHRLAGPGLLARNDPAGSVQARHVRRPARLLEPQTGGAATKWCSSPSPAVLPPASRWTC